MNKPRVLMTASTFPRFEGDTEPRFILDLAKTMERWYDVTVLVPMDPGAKEYEVMEGVKVRRYHYFPLHSMETLCYPGAIVQRIKESKPRIFLVPFLAGALFMNLFKLRKSYDLVHAHWFIPQGIVQSFFSVPYVVTGHGGDVTSLNHFLIRKLKKDCVERAGYVTVVSSFLKEEVLRWINTEKISVLPMGCQLSTFSPDNRRENYFGQGKDKVVLFVGRLAEVKGIQYLIQAMEQVDAKLVIVGKGSLEMQLRDQASHLGEKVTFLGAKTHEELGVIYASADLFVMPSVTAADGGREGFGLVILEAMASGTPVVAFNSGGISQLISHETNGLLCEERNVQQLADSMNRLLDDSALRDRLVKSGLKSAAQYDYKEIGKRYSQIYAEVLREHD